MSDQKRKHWCYQLALSIFGIPSIMLPFFSKKLYLKIQNVAYKVYEIIINTFSNNFARPLIMLFLSRFTFKELLKQPFSWKLQSLAILTKRQVSLKLCFQKGRVARKERWSYRGQYIEVVQSFTYACATHFFSFL